MHWKSLAEHGREWSHQSRRVAVFLVLALDAPRLPRGQEQRPRGEQERDHQTDGGPLRGNGDFRHSDVSRDVGAHGVGHGQHEEPEVLEQLDGAEEEGDQEDAGEWRQAVHQARLSSRFWTNV